MYWSVGVFGCNFSDKACVMSCVSSSVVTVAVVSRSLIVTSSIAGISSVWAWLFLLFLLLLTSQHCDGGKDDNGSDDNDSMKNYFKVHVCSWQEDNYHWSQLTRVDKLTKLTRLPLTLIATYTNWQVEHLLYQLSPHWSSSWATQPDGRDHSLNIIWTIFWTIFWTILWTIFWTIFWMHIALMHPWRKRCQSVSFLKMLHFVFQCEVFTEEYLSWE